MTEFKYRTNVAFIFSDMSFIFLIAICHIKKQ